MSDQEHEQQDENAPGEREETLKDLEVPEEDGSEVTGGQTVKYTDKT